MAVAPSLHRLAPPGRSDFIISSDDYINRLIVRVLNSMRTRLHAAAYSSYILKLSVLKDVSRVLWFTCTQRSVQGGWG